MRIRSAGPLRVAALLAVMVGLPLGGCKRRAPEPPPPPLPGLGAVLLADVTPRGASSTTKLDAAALGAALRARLLSSGLVIDVSDSDAGGPSAEVRVRGEFALDGAEVPGRAMARAAVRLQLDTRPSDAPRALDEQLAAQGEQTYSLPAAGSASAQAITDLRREVFTKLVLRVAGELVDGVAARAKLHEAAPEAVHAALAADGGELREEAIRIAGQKQLRQEVPRLLQLLADDDEPTRDAALGALLAMKDRRAVAVLTRSRSFRDRREMQKIIEAISVLGGQEALDYLSFVADTHDDPDLKSQAAEARNRLLRRMDAGQSPP